MAMADETALGENLLVVAETMVKIENFDGCGLNRPGKAPLDAVAPQSVFAYTNSARQEFRLVSRARAFLCLRTSYVRSM